MVDTIISKFKKKITLTDKKFIWNAVFRLKHLVKVSFIHHRVAKKHMNVLHTDTTIKSKQWKLDTWSAWKIRLVARSILVQTLELSILATLDKVADSYQIAVMAIRPFLDVTTDMCLTICKDENRMNLVILNILCILIDMYDKNQANNKFHQILYIALCNFFWKEDVMVESTSLKL